MYWGEGTEQLGLDRIAVTVRVYTITNYHPLLSNCQPAWPAMPTFSRSNVLRSALRPSIVAGSRRGVANKAYPDHIQLSTFEHAFLTVGTGLAALLDPRRGGEYDKLGEN